MIFSEARRFGLSLAGARMRRLLLLVGLASAAVPVGSALADTTVGQTGPPLSSQVFGGLTENIETSAAMPSAGIVTSFNTEASSCSGALGAYDFQVLRPLGGDQYQVLGHTGTQQDPCDSQLHSFPPVNANGAPTTIPVEAGDVIGAYVASGWQGLLSVTSGTTSRTLIIVPTAPAVGDVITAPDTETFTLDESATLVPPLPTSRDQCKNGGWQTFGVFKNQGDCVSFVATGGTNPANGPA